MKRPIPGVIAVAFVLTIISQLLPLLPATASAGQISKRSITMATSAPGASTYNGFSNTYTVGLTPATTETNPDIIINFCNAATDPIPGDTCSGTPGTDIPSFSSPTATGWTVTTIDSGQSLKLTTTSSPTWTAGTAISPIVISGVTNPSATAGFYARILIYAHNGAGASSPAGYTSPTSVGTNLVDFGGIALSTASNISITSKVFETLTFCVFVGTCGTPPNIKLGDPTTGALSATSAYLDGNSSYTLATNAANGVNVTMTGPTLCRATPVNATNCPTGASNETISATGSTAKALGQAPQIGTPQFGMCAGVNGSSALTVAPTYTDSTGAACQGLTPGPNTYSGTSTFGFNDSAASGGTNSAGGSQVLTSTGAVPSVTGQLGFAADISVNTVAGIYTTTLNMVATGTF